MIQTLITHSKCISNGKVMEFELKPCPTISVYDCTNSTMWTFSSLQVEDLLKLYGAVLNRKGGPVVVIDDPSEEPFVFTLGFTDSYIQVSLADMENEATATIPYEFVLENLERLKEFFKV